MEDTGRGTTKQPAEKGSETAFLASEGQIEAWLVIRQQCERPAGQWCSPHVGGYRNCSLLHCVRVGKAAVDADPRWVAGK